MGILPETEHTGADAVRQRAGTHQPALVIAWWRSAPDRVGEVLLADDTPRVFGRGHRDGGLEMVVPVRQRPGRNEPTAPVMARRLSRQALSMVRAGEGAIQVFGLGSRALRVDGCEVPTVTLRPGRVLEIAGEMVLLCVDRPAVLPPSAAPHHRFGGPDGDGILGESPSSWALRDALAFAARERPKTPLGRYLAHFDQLAQQVSEAVDEAAPAERRAEALAEVIHGAFGYAGDSLTYDDLQNADMVRVIDRRKGLPVALGILHLAVARRLDWPLVGLAFPGHFLLMLEHQGQRLPLDPFDGGAILSAADMRRILKTVHGEQAELTADCYEPVSDRAVLLRLQNNIKLRRLKIGDIPGALRVAEGMFAFAPATAELAREIAMMHTRLENISEAIRHFELYLAAEPNDALRHKAAALLQDLKNRLN